jgi:tetratricopeptide (TPR) repeat protein
MQPTETLDEQTYQHILRLSEAGDVCIEQDDYDGAASRFQEALALVPKPHEEWEAATWLLTSLGESYFFAGRYEEARTALERAMHTPNAIGNPLIHLRLGQTHFELDNMERAADELLRAYMAEGKDIFEGEDEKYFAFLKTSVKL